MPAPADIVIEYDGTDITDRVIYSTAHFEMNANALPGQFSFQCKDMDRTDEYITGKEVTVDIDGVRVFGGIVLQVRRLFAFPAVDTSDLSSVDSRLWELIGADYNIWLDKLVLRNTSDYLRAIVLDGPEYDGVYIRDHLPDYFDLPAGLDMESEVQDILLVGKTGRYALPTQGSTFREVMEDFVKRSGGIYYIDANKKMNYTAVGETLHPWSFVDRAPNGVTTIGCRDVTAVQDGSSIVTDALIWSGNEIFADSEGFQPQSGIFFARFPDPPANLTIVDGQIVWTEAEEQRGIDKQDAYGRWQFAEHRFGSGEGPEPGALRAKHIVLGPSGTKYGIEGGLGTPLWNITLTWFAHNVPSGNHIPAGHIGTIILYAMGTDAAHPLVQVLPLRHASISFPVIPENPTGTQTYVQFQGQFGLTYADHRALWRFLKEARKSVSKIPVATSVNGSSETSSFGAFGAFTPTSIGEISQVGFGYQVPFPYISGTIDVYLNGLLQRPFIEYLEYDPTEGIITFFSELLDTDEVYVTQRTGQSA